MNVLSHVESFTTSCTIMHMFLEMAVITDTNLLVRKALPSLSVAPLANLYAKIIQFCMLRYIFLNQYVLPTYRNDSFILFYVIFIPTYFH